MSLLRYISHPDVDVDPDVPVTQWTLSVEGRRRATAMLDQPWVPSIERIVSSAETKATVTAGLLADHLGLDVEVRPTTGEIDRSATGFVPMAEHERLADAFFDRPTVSAQGWERAVDAQARIVEALADLLDPTSVSGDVAVVGHGAVGTLLLCHLADLEIGRHRDQPGQGHHWAYDLGRRHVVHGWIPVDGGAQREEPQA